jgi:hypothetical protein
MRKPIAALAAAAILMAGAFAANVDAQSYRGAASILAASQNFTPIERAECGPDRGRFCGPHHHRVCAPYGHCWCAPC